MNWLTEERKTQIRSLFEIKYGKKLNNKEIESIAQSLASTAEIIMKMKNSKNAKYRPNYN